MNAMTELFTIEASAETCAAFESARLSMLTNRDVLVTYERVPGGFMLVVPTLPETDEPVLVCDDSGDGFEAYEHAEATGLLDVDSTMEDVWYEDGPSYSRDERAFFVTHTMAVSCG